MGLSAREQWRRVSDKQMTVETFPVKGRSSSDYFIGFILIAE